MNSGWIGRLFIWFGLIVPAAFWLGSTNAAETKTASSPKVADPKFSIRGGLYTNAVSVKLSAGSPSEVVRYTLDGSEPTSASTAYSSPINISESTLLKVKAFGSGASTSVTAAEAYSFMEPDLATF